VWILQGDEDVVVPKKAADKLVELAGRRDPDWVIKDTVRSRGGTGWMQGGLCNGRGADAGGVHFFTRYWLA
jgi:hypothetical protein